MNTSIKAIIVFAIEVFTGAIIFLLISGVAIGLNVLIHKLQETQIDGIIIKALTNVEFFIFFVDLSLFVLFILRSSYKLIIELWKH